MSKRNTKVIITESSYEHQRARIFRSRILKSVYDTYLNFVDKRWISPILEQSANRKDKVVVVGQGSDDLKNPNVSFKSFKDYIGTEYDMISFKKAESLARTWYKTEISQLISYENLNLGEVVERQFMMFLNDTIKFAIAMKNLIKKEKPNSVILEDENILTCKIAKIVANMHHLHVSNLVPKQISEFKMSFKNSTLRLRSLKRSLKIKNKHLPHGQTNRKNKVLIISLFPTNLEALLPLEKKLRGKNDVFVVGSHREYFGQDNLKKEKLNFTYIEDFYTEPPKANFLQAWNKLSNNEDFKNIFTFDRIPLWDAVEDELHSLFSIQFNELARYIDAAKNLIETERPSIILFFNDTRPIERIFIRLAKLNKIPTLLIQKTLYSRDYPFEFSFTDKVTVDGEVSKKILIERGADKNNIIISGSLILDGLLDVKRNSNKQDLFKELDLDLNKKLVVFTSQPLPREEREKIFYSLFKSFKDSPDYQLVVKLHPVEDLILPQEIARNVGVEKDVLITKNINLHKLIYCCDLMMSAFSTTILDAFILDKPVISINFFKRPYPYPYDFIESGAAFGVFKPEDILPAVNKVFTNSETIQKLKRNRKKFLERYHEVDGKTSERISQLIDTMISSSKRNSA